MLTLEMAIQKIQELPPEQQNQAIAFIEKLEFQSNQGANAQTSQEPEKISFAENDCVEEDEEFEAIENDCVEEDEEFEAIAGCLSDEFLHRR